MRLVLTILFICFLSVAKSQSYQIRTIAVGTVSDTIYLKFNSEGASTDSFYRYNGVSYVFAYAPKIKTYFPLQQVVGLETALNTKMSANGNGSALTGLTKSQIGLSNVDNTSDAAKPISTATQTALNAKQNTITTGTTAQYFRGDLSLANYSGYSINVQAITSSPTDAQTVYFGTLPKAPVTAAATSKIYVRTAGTITAAEIYCYSGTAGTNEAWSLYIRLNNTTDYLIGTLSVSASERVFTNSGLSISLAANDYFEIKSIQPTWVTNPLTTIYGGYIKIN